MIGGRSSGGWGEEMVVGTLVVDAAEGSRITE